MITEGSGLLIDGVILGAEGRPSLDLMSGNMPLVQIVNIYESIFEQYQTASLIIHDGLGLIETYPITGLEYIYIRYTSVESMHTPLEKVFRIYDIQAIEHDPLKPRMMYRLELVSDLLIQSNKQQLQCSYFNKTEDEIVKIICEDNLDVDITNKFTSDTAQFKRNITAPNMTPLEFIDYMTDQAVNTRPSQAANFLFFENSRGANFVSMETLFEKDVDWNLGTITGSNPVTEEGFSNIQNLTVQSLGKPVENRKKFIFGGKMQKVDLIEKTVTSRDYSFEKDLLESQAYIDEKGFTPWTLREDDLSPRSRIETVYNHGSFKYLDKSIPTRCMSMAQLDGIVITVTMSGNTGITAGDKVNLRYPSIVTDDQGRKHRYLSGNYIVANCNQQIIQNLAYTVLDLVKPTYRNEIEEMSR